MLQSSRGRFLREVTAVELVRQRVRFLATF